MTLIGVAQDALSPWLHSVFKLLDTPFLHGTTGKIAIASFSFIFAILSVLVFTFIYTNVRYRYQLSRLSKDSPQRPPAIPYTIPFLGSAIDFLAPKPTLFWKNLFSYHPRETGACTLLLGGQHTHILFDPAAITSLFKAKEPTRDKFNEQLMENVFSMPKVEIEKFWGAKGEIFVDEKGNEIASAKKRQEDIWHEYLIKTESVAELTREFTKLLRESMLADEKLRNGETVEVGIVEWLRGHMFKASTNALMGTRFLEIYPELNQDFWEFDKAFLALFFGLPKAVMKKEHAILQKCLEGTKLWHKTVYEESNGTPEDPKAASWEPLFGSRVNRARHIYFQSRNLSSDTMAAIDLGIMFGLSSNAIPSAGWMIMHIIDPNGDKTLLPRVMKELRSARNVDGSLDISKLIALPLLQSIFQEALRLYTDVLVTRTLPSDLILPMKDGKQKMMFPKDSIVMAASYLGHHDAEKWDSPEAPCEMFYAERFLKEDPTTGKETFTMAGTTGKFFPFGGGKTICPGRVFAKQEVLGAVAIVLLEYDLRAVDYVDARGNKTSKFPGLMDAYGGNGIMPMDGDIKVKLTHHKH
jgi:hypothetical protein